MEARQQRSISEDNHTFEDQIKRNGIEIVRKDAMREKISQEIKYLEFR